MGTTATASTAVSTVSADSSGGTGGSQTHATVPPSAELKSTFSAKPKRPEALLLQRFISDDTIRYR